MHVRLFRSKGLERVAFVALVPASSGTGLLVQTAKGASRLALTDTKVYGPFAAKEAHEVFAREVDVLRADGFRKSGLGDLLVRLESKKRRTRALAARRLGWLREPGASEGLLALAAKAKEELPVVLDALGELGDPLALPVLRAAAEKKLLSRRRSAVEALRKMGDVAGIADAKNRALERLPQTVRDHLADPNAGEAETISPMRIAGLAAVVRAVPLKDRGLAIDTLYELATPLTIGATRTLVVEDGIDAPHMWRYVKSVLKRAMLRYDFLTFATIVYRVELTARVSKGTTATVKSGFDGELKEMRIFGAETTRYVRRAGWRYLRALAQHRPSWYAYAAAEAIAPYAQIDQEKPRGLQGGFAGAYLLNRVLWGGGTRYQLDGRTLRFSAKNAAAAKVPANVREEAHPLLWDLEPDAYVRVLAAARLPLVHEWALRAIERAHPEVIARASHASIVGMLSAPHAPTVALALAEIERRFDAAKPDLELLRHLLADARADVREVGIRLLAASSAAWTADAAAILSLLEATDASARAAVATSAIAAVATMSEATKRDLVAGLLAVLARPEPEEAAHDAHAEIARSLATDIARLASMPALLALLAAASPAAQSVGAAAIAARADAVAELGKERVVALAVHPHALIREAGRRILDRMGFELASDASPLYPLLDSEWPDARAYAVEAFRTKLDPASFSLEIIIGLCDSPHADVQAFARDLVTTRLDAPREAKESDELIEKLVQHPQRAMRRFALGLIAKKLRPGFVRLAPLEEFFRTILLDVAPDRAMKREAIAFLERRGQEDELQAEVAARILGEVARSKTKDDFQRTVVALARIQVAFPAVKSVLALDAAAAAPTAEAAPSNGGAA